LAEGWCAAAVAGRLLSELGARVIKVEPPEGDRLRRQPPNAADGTSPTFQNLNSNKESIVLGADSEALLELIGKADILLTDQTTLNDRKINLNDDELQRLNPRLVACHFSPFGRTGALAGRPGGELIAQAMGGVIATTGHPGELPHRAGQPLASHNAALLGGAAILSALYDLKNSDKGSIIDMSLYDASVSLLYTFLPAYFLSGNTPGPMGNKHMMVAPWDNYPTKDGWVIVCIANDRQWHDFLRLMGRAELIEDPRFAENDQRVLEGIRPLVDGLVIEYLADKTTDEAIQLLRDHNVPAGPVYDVPMLMENPQFLAREMVRTFDDPATGSYRTSGSIFKMSETPGRVHSPAPALGQHGNIEREAKS
jgi:CoA:oxalate CoA-transferase